MEGSEVYIPPSKVTKPLQYSTTVTHHQLSEILSSPLSRLHSRKEGMTHLVRSFFLKREVALSPYFSLTHFLICNIKDSRFRKFCLP
jgi:hypothetical protein